MEERSKAKQLDDWIVQLRQCRALSEEAVQALCDKVEEGLLCFAVLVLLLKICPRVCSKNNFSEAV
jgi:hypothetical protein